MDMTCPRHYQLRGRLRVEKGFACVAPWWHSQIGSSELAVIQVNPVAVRAV